MKYFFTCGRGTETYVAQELNEKFPGSTVSAYGFILTWA